MKLNNFGIIDTTDYESVNGVGVFVKKGGEFLILEKPYNDPLSGFLMGIGGYQKTGETPVEAAKREAREELGLDLLELNLKCDGTVIIVPQRKVLNIQLFKSELTDEPKLKPETGLGRLEWINQNQLIFNENLLPELRNNVIKHIICDDSGIGYYKAYYKKQKNIFVLSKIFFDIIY